MANHRDVISSKVTFKNFSQLCFFLAWKGWSVNSLAGCIQNNWERYSCALLCISVVSSLKTDAELFAVSKCPCLTGNSLLGSHLLLPSSILRAEFKASLEFISRLRFVARLKVAGPEYLAWASYTWLYYSLVRAICSQIHLQPDRSIFYLARYNAARKIWLVATRACIWWHV